MAVIEYARNVAGLAGANSEEADPQAKHKVIHVMPEQKKYLEAHQYGGTIRLGSWPCVVLTGTILEKSYLKFGKQPNEILNSQFSILNQVKNLNLNENLKSKIKNLVFERHRHRYEFNNEYREQLEKAGLVISGVSPDGELVEAIELPKEKHPFFMATQFHPEYKSRPLSPHPIFVSFIEAAIKSPPSHKASEG